MWSVEKIDSHLLKLMYDEEIRKYSNQETGKGTTKFKSNKKF